LVEIEICLACYLSKIVNESPPSEKQTAGNKKLRQSGGLHEIHDFASPPRGGFAISDEIEFGIKL
jgi:hypothetical protein